MKYNKLLEKQIRRTLKDQENIPEGLVSLLTTISNSYDHFDRDRKLLERAMELSSEEIRASYEQKLIQTELKRSNESLEQFVSIASHDLKSPLRTVSSFTNLLERELKGKLSKEGKEYMNFILSGVTRMRTLLDDLTNFAKIGMDKNDPEVVDFNLILEGVLRDLSYNIKETQAEIISNDILPTLLTHPYQVTQLFQNIIGNALKFKKKDVAAKICIRCKNENGSYIISISDNGIGMDPKQQSKAFEAFTRLSYQTDVQGSGLGLSICKKIVDSWRGNIYFESELGKGTTIVFTIPQTKVNTSTLATVSASTQRI